MYNQAQVTLHFAIGQWRKLTFNKIGCQKYDAPTQSACTKYYFHEVPCKCVKRFNLNLLLWVGQNGV